MDNTPVLVAVIVGFGGTLFTVIGCYLQLNKRFDDVLIRIDRLNERLLDHASNLKIHQENT